MEVTWWNFERASSTSLNLFSDGSISAEYLLTRHTIPFRPSFDLAPRPCYNEARTILMR